MKARTVPKWQQNVMIGISSLIILAVTLMIDAWFPNSFLIVPTGACLLILNLMRFWFSRQLTMAADFIIRYRWLFAFAIFALLVAFDIHTSNVPAYADTYTHDSSVLDSILFGVARPSRSDEFNVQLPYYFSQLYNQFKEISHQMSVSGQDMILGYNAPVANLSMLGKPQTWGYILLGNTKGLAWYFSFKNVMTFMAAFEMFNVLTRSRYMAAFGAFFILYSPGMQWWFSPHFFDVMMWSMILFDAGYYFVWCRGWKKWFVSLLSIFALTGFTLAIFPSLQVPCGMLMLALLIACVLRDRKSILWKKADLLNVLFVVAGVAIVLGSTLWNMRDQLDLLMNTVYPGHRVSLGGYGRIYQLFTNVAAPIQPFADPDLLNNSEFAQFNHYGVACILFYPILWVFLFRSRDPQRYVGDVFFVALIIEALFLMFPIPEWLAKVSLLSMCNRMQTVLGFTAAIFTVWFARTVWTVNIPYKALFGLAVCAVYCMLSLSDIRSIMMPSFAVRVGVDYFTWMTIVLAAVFWLCFTSWRPVFFAFMTGWTVMSGCLINPIVQGDAAVTDYSLIQAAKPYIEQEPDAWWLSLNSLTTANLLMANGAKVLDATNFYPDYEKWKLIDPELENADAVNRYANMAVSLQGGEDPSTFTNPRPDYLQLELNPSDLQKLGVRYLTAAYVDTLTLRGWGIPYEVLYKDPFTGERILRLLTDEEVSQKTQDGTYIDYSVLDEFDTQTPLEQNASSSALPPRNPSLIITPEKRLEEQLQAQQEQQNHQEPAAQEHVPEEEQVLDETAEPVMP